MVTLTSGTSLIPAKFLASMHGNMQAMRNLVLKLARFHSKNVDYQGLKLWCLLFVQETQNVHHILILFSFTHCSTMTLAITAFEKFINIYFPIKAKELCTVQNAQRVMVTLFLCFSAFDAQWFFIFGYEESTNKCYVTTKAEDLFKVYNQIDAALYSYIPISSMIVFNTAIVVKLFFAKKSGNQSSLSKAARGATMMLVGTCIIFVVLTIPKASMYKVSSGLSTYLHVFITLLMYTNHTINILVYTLSNSQFRKEARNFFGCKRLGVYPLDSSTGTGRTETA